MKKTNEMRKNLTDTPCETMSLGGLIACNLYDVHLSHNIGAHEPVIIYDLTAGTLTERGKEDWADVLNAKVEQISHDDGKTQISLSGVEEERIQDFSCMLERMCPADDFEKWVNEENGMSELDEASGMTFA